MAKKEGKMTRKIIMQREIEEAWTVARNHFELRRKEKGYASFSSILEMRGSIDEEVLELKEALHKKDYFEIEHELKDVITSCMFGLACLKAGAFEY